MTDVDIRPCVAAGEHLVTQRHPRTECPTEAVASRSYVVGLPVSITVRDDGWVQAECDLSEAGQSIRKDWEPDADDPNPPTDEQLDADALLVDRWSALYMLAHGEFAPDAGPPPGDMFLNPALGPNPMDADKDLPPGYRWADEDETERIAAGDWTGDAIVVPRSADASGTPYTQGESDIAVPITKED